MNSKPPLYLPKSPGESRSIVDADERADSRLAKILGVSVREAQRVLKSRSLLIDGVWRTLKKGDRLSVTATIEVPDYQSPGKQRPIANKEALPPILTKGNGWIAVDKPAGTPVHPLNPGEKDTLLNGLISAYPDLSGVGESGLRSGVVHRLDVGTSGAIIFATVESVYRKLRSSFSQHRVEKYYFAVVEGFPKPNGEIELPLYVAQHSPARVRVAPKTSTRRTWPCDLSWRVIRRSGKHSLVEVRIWTGFLHQIRVGLSHMGFPVIGDPIYGKGKLPDRLMLHSGRIRLEEEGIDVQSPYPETWPNLKPK